MVLDRPTAWCFPSLRRQGKASPAIWGGRRGDAFTSTRSLIHANASHRSCQTSPLDSLCSERRLLRSLFIPQLLLETDSQCSVRAGGLLCFTHERRRAVTCSGQRSAGLADSS